MNMRTRVVIVGGGHNALVSATYLARAGFTTTVLERLPHVGGAAVSIRPFEGVDAKLSRYSYLVSLMPEALIADLGLNLELRSRDTASYTPYEGPHGPAGLMIESVEGEATRQSFRELTGDDREHESWTKFYADVGTLANAIAPTLLNPLPEVARVREQVEASLWRELIVEPLGKTIERRFENNLVRGVVATDALIGTFASLQSDSLLQNRCFLYHLIGNGTGEWRVPVGGMGAVTGELERVAREAGAEIRTGATVTSIDAHEAGATIRGDGFDIEADWVLSGVAPYVLAELLGDPLPEKPQGSQFKANILVTRLPRLKSGADPEVAFAGTLHLNESYGELEDAFQEAADGDVPAHLPGEIYCHTLTDESILGADLAASGAHTMTYFGLHTPADVLAGAQQEKLAWHRFLDSLNSHLAEPIEGLFVTDERGNPCVESKTPSEIEQELAMPGGHIFHGDLSWPWLDEGSNAETPAQKWGVATSHPRVLLAGAGAVRGGAVSGIAGHNAAHALLDIIANGPKI